MSAGGPSDPKSNGPNTNHGKAQAASPASSKTDDAWKLTWKPTRLPRPLVFLPLELLDRFVLNPRIAKLEDELEMEKVKNTILTWTNRELGKTIRELQLERFSLKEDLAKKNAENARLLAESAELKAKLEGTVSSAPRTSIACCTHACLLSAAANWGFTVRSDQLGASVKGIIRWVAGGWSRSGPQ